MPPTRIRWRIIHISKEANLNLILEEMTNHENIKNLYLFKIPFLPQLKKFIRRSQENQKY